MPERVIRVPQPDGSFKEIVFPEGTSDADIEEALGAGPPTMLGRVAKFLTPQVDPEVGIAALPAAGGALGSVLGGAGGTAFGFGIGGVPGAIGGAALGTAGGEALRQLIQRARGNQPVPATPLEAATEIGKEGLIGAATEGAGAVAAPVVKGLAKGVYKFGTRPTPTLLRQFPAAVEDALERNAIASTRGVTAADEAITASAQQADELVAAAEAAGESPLNVRTDVLQPVAAEVGPQVTRQTKLGRQGPRGALSGRLSRVREAFRAPTPRPPAAVPEAAPVRELTPGYEALLQQQYELGPLANILPTRLFEPTSHEVRMGLELGHRAMLVPRRLISGPASEVVENAVRVPPPRIYRDIPLTEAQALKREAQDLATAAYRAEERGAPINAIEAATDQAMAKALRTGIEARVPAVGAINEETQRRLGVRRLVEDAVLKGGGLTSNVVAGAAASSAPSLFATGHPVAGTAALLTGGAVKGLTSPHFLTSTGVALKRAAPYQAQAYRAILELLRQGINPSELGTSITQ